MELSGQGVETCFTLQPETEKMRLYFSLDHHLAGCANLVLAVFFLVNMEAGSSWAGKEVSACYTESRGTHIQWTIRVPSPPPAAVIVIQYIRPGSDILSSSHPLSFYDSKRGMAKWLLTPVSPGKLRMDIRISKAVRRKGEIHGEVVFKDAARNTTASVFMKPGARRKALEGC